MKIFKNRLVYLLEKIIENGLKYHKFLKILQKFFESFSQLVQNDKILHNYVKTVKNIQKLLKFSQKLFKITDCYEN